jgi:hypothetical protein
MTTTKDREHETFLSDLSRVLRAATLISGDPKVAEFWVGDERISCFHQKTAATLVAEGRVDAVLDYLASIESGSLG